MKKLIIAILAAIVLFGCSKKTDLLGVKETRVKPSGTFYFQLEIVDIDGNKQYSEVRTLTY